MATADRPASETTHGATSRRALLLATFTAAITLSAALVFMVQPMFTKMVLPRFGGAPSVWSMAIVFFQTALLAGYAYAHWLTRYASGRASVAIHLVVMVAAAFALPLSIAAGCRGSAVADRVVHSLDRPAVFCARRQQSVVAGLVRAHGSPRRERPVFPLCRQQCRKLPRARVLSDRYRAVRATRRSSMVLVDRLLLPHCAARCLRGAAMARAEPRCACQRRRGCAADLEGCRLLDRARGGARGPPGRGDRAHFDRCGGGTAPLGASACALSLDLRHRVRAPADRPALGGGRRATGVHHCARCGDHLRSDQDHRRAARRAPLGFLRQRVDVPWRAGAHEASAEISHRVLPLDIGGRRDRRPRGR